MTRRHRESLAAALALGFVAIGLRAAHAAAPPAHLALVGRSAASALAVVAAGPERVFLATDVGVVALTISGESPQELGRRAIGDGPLTALAADGPTRVYAAAEPGTLLTVDASDPAAMRQLGALEVGASVSGLSASGQWVLLALGTAGFALADVSDPAAPRLVGRLPTTMKTRDVVLAWPHAYLAERDAFNAMLRVVDLSDPATPRELAQLPLPGGADRLVLDGDRLVAIGASGWAWTIDVTDPARPTRLAPLVGAGGIRFRDVAVSGSYAFVAAESSSGLGALAVVELGNGKALQQVNNLSLPAVPLDLALAGGWLWVAGGSNGWFVFDVRQPTTPRYLGGTVSLVGDVADMVLVDDHLYLVGSGGLRTIDVSVPGRQSVVHTLGILGQARDLVYRPEAPELIIAGGPVGCVHGSPCNYLPIRLGLQRVFVGQPELPLLVGGDSDLATLAVTADSEHVFAVVQQSFASGGPSYGWRAGLGMFSLFGNAAAPRPRSIAPFVAPTGLADRPVELAVRAGHVFAAMGETGFNVFDVRDVDNVRRRASLLDAGLNTGSSVLAVDDQVLVGTQEGLVVLDVSEPAAPQVVAQTLVPGGVQHLAQADAYVLAVAGQRVQLYHSGTAAEPALVDELALGWATPCAGGQPCAQPTVGYDRPRVVARGRRVFVALPGRGVSELAIVDGPRPTPSPAPGGLATATATPSSTASDTATPAETVRSTVTAPASATPQPTRRPDSVILPLVYGGP
jgi:hypothetical protein